VLLSKMRPPLEDELLKRSAAVCRAAAAELQYAVMVADRGMAGRGLERLAREPAVRVAGAWLVEAESGLLASWRREVEAGPPAHWWFAAQGRTTRRMLEADGHPYALVGCPVEAMKDAGSAPAALLRPGGGAGDAGLLWLLVDAEEVSGTVRRGFLGALGIVSLAIFLAVGLQLAIALFVIARLSESMRQLRETRGRLVKADKLAALGTLSAGVAHEINNPLSYVVANLEYLARGLGGPKPPGPDEVVDFREALAEARQGAERVRVIVRDLKALARGDEDKVAPLDVRRVAESSINIAMNEIKHRARLVRDFDEVAPVDANDVRLGQVFLNLLLNAVHAIPEGRIDANQIRVATRPWPDGRVAVEVRDTGAGIAAENLPRLFDPFFTTKPVGQGTGLGLWVCHGIVTSLGGEIFVESEVGKGTAVRVLLPPSKGASATDASPSPAEESRGRILVVDDEILVGRSIERLLGLQHDVVAVARASEALRRIDEGERFDAILCDVMIPEMTGIELLEELRRRHPELAERVVFITGSAFTPGTAERLQRIPNVRLDKPFDRARLQAALGAILRRRVEPPPLDQPADRPRLVAAG
jgi:signal transduction histidine kinase/CheY-like chemotaxis protein